MTHDIRKLLLDAARYVDRNGVSGIEQRRVLADELRAAAEFRSNIDRQSLIDKFEALKTLHFDGGDDFNRGCRYAAKTIIGMLMTGDFDLPLEADHE